MKEKNLNRSNCLKFFCRIKSYVVLFLCMHLSMQLFSQDVLLKPQSIYSSNFIIDGIQRNFLYYAPLHYGNNDSYPLIILLHAKDQTGKDLLNKYGDQVHAGADSVNAVVVYPDAVAKHWNAFEKFPATDTINDVGFLSILIDYFIQQYQCNEKEVYVAGFENGAAMAIKLAATPGTKIASIAPFFYDNDTVKNKINKSVKVMNTSNIETDDGSKPYNSAIREAFKYFESQLR